ncbi:hypothetical protein OHA25_10035 [Nonomuraea sp. NBC_00507]|uniref:hypothetical protein n=1 Tax=Nonomuraea sp. NBC_00507 TaxID=2976002 RepID=UPI002E17F26B
MSTAVATGETEPSALARSEGSTSAHEPSPRSTQRGDAEISARYVPSGFTKTCVVAERSDSTSIRRPHARAAASASPSLLIAAAAEQGAEVEPFALAAARVPVAGVTYADSVDDIKKARVKLTARRLTGIRTLSNYKRGCGASITGAAASSNRAIYRFYNRATRFLDVLA